MKTILLLSLILCSIAYAQDFPAHWWQEIPREDAASWEILPQDALAGEVILSKRTELGVFSHFAATPFQLDEEDYASIEGLWQSLKYPDPSIADDPRLSILTWPHTRQSVRLMVGNEAKQAGKKANALYQTHGLRLVSYGADFFDYLDHAEGSQKHFDLLKRAMRAKLDQNPGLWELLLKTKCLRLKPDHRSSSNSEPRSYRYYEMYMQLREERLPCSSSL